MGIARDAITLHIETLVLDGFPGGSRHAVGDAVQRELARLLSEEGTADALCRGGRDSVIDGGTFALASRADARASGTGIARRVHASLSQGEDK